MNQPVLRTLQRRFDRQAIDQLRKEVTKLHERLEEAEQRQVIAEQDADFWQRHADDIRTAFDDEEFATDRCIGLSKDGELMVVRTDKIASE